MTLVARRSDHRQLIRASTARDRATKVGFDYVHSLVDDRSRLAYARS
jgi:hypothetical protein